MSFLMPSRTHQGLRGNWTWVWQACPWTKQLQKLNLELVSSPPYPCGNCTWASQKHGFLWPSYVQFQQWLMLARPRFSYHSGYWYGLVCQTEFQFLAYPGTVPARIRWWTHYIQVQFVRLWELKESGRQVLDLSQCTKWIWVWYASPQSLPVVTEPGGSGRQVCDLSHCRNWQVSHKQHALNHDSANKATSSSHITRVHEPWHFRLWNQISIDVTFQLALAPAIVDVNNSYHIPLPIQPTSRHNSFYAYNTLYIH